MSKWEEIYKNKIPFDDYEIKLINGEENGLVIELKSRTRTVVINFGIIKALRMLDEGIIFEGVHSDTEIKKYKKNNFKNIIYKAKNEEFENQVKCICGNFAQAFDFKHYIIITMNFSIDIVTEWEPDITIVKNN